MNHLRALAASLATLSLAFTTGCSREYLYDDVDLVLDFDLTPSNELAHPYVLGSKFAIHVGGFDRGGENPPVYTLASSAPSVIALSACTDSGCSVDALAEGAALVSAYDEHGELVAAEEVTVLAPDRVELSPHGREIVKSSWPISEARILVGGTATYLATCYRGEQRLNGNGVLAATSDGVDLTVERTFLFENRDWLQLTPPHVGDFTVSVSASGLPMRDLDVPVVDADAVASVEVIQEELEDGDRVTVLGEALDAEGRVVHGVQFSWDLDGDGQAGLGDLFRYEYSEEVEKLLGAEFDGLRGETVIHAERGIVADSNALGCSASRFGARAPLGGAALTLAFAALFVKRSRSRRTS